MKYAQHGSKFKKNKPAGKRSVKKALWITFGVLAIVLLVVFWFVLRPENGIPDEPLDEVEQVQGSDQVDEGIDSVTQGDAGALNTDSGREEILLAFIGEEEGAFGGTARKGHEDGLFTHVVVADLPAINTGAHFYEGWLVKPGVVEFFSTGEMFPRADGKWGLVWETRLDEARDDLAEFTRVVITLEPRDGDPAPAAAHVLEGEFPR